MAEIQRQSSPVAMRNAMPTLDALPRGLSRILGIFHSQGLLGSPGGIDVSRDIDVCSRCTSMQSHTFSPTKQKPH